MSITMRCSHCGQAYPLTPEQAPQYAGQTITCTNCQKPFVVQLEGVAAAQPAYATPAGFGQQPQFQPPSGAQRSNGLAIASLIVGVLGFCVPLLGIVAIILGALGLNKTKDRSVGGKGLAIAGLSLGVVSLLFMVLSLSILLPSLNRAREMANRVKCASNMRQIGLALTMYANENKGEYPPDLATLFNTQDLQADAFICPSTDHTAAAGTPTFAMGSDLSYVYIGKDMTERTAGADSVVLYEPATNHVHGGNAGHDGGNVLYGDKHVEFIQDINAMIAKLNAGQNPPQ